MHPGRTGASVRPHPQRSAAALTSGSDGDVEMVPGHVCQVIRGGKMSENNTWLCVEVGAHGCARAPGVHPSFSPEEPVQAKFLVSSSCFSPRACNCNKVVHALAGEATLSLGVANASSKKMKKQ